MKLCWLGRGLSSGESHEETPEMPRRTLCTSTRGLSPEASAAAAAALHPDVLVHDMEGRPWPTQRPGLGLRCHPIVPFKGFMTAKLGGESLMNLNLRVGAWLHSGHLGSALSLGRWEDA